MPETVRVFLVVVLCLVAATASAQETRPNVVIFLADDLGVGDLGAYGQTRIATPYLDRIAREGVLARHAYAAAPVCAPSRCALMTGMHTGHCSVDHNEEPNLPLGLSDPTIAEVLAREGYRTGIVGKWGLGGETDEGEPFGTSSLPTEMGFEHVFAVLDQQRAQDHFPDRVFVDGAWRELPGNAEGARALFDADLFLGDALAFIAAASADPRPFFLYFASTLPHRTFDPRSLSHPDADWPDVERAYATMVERFDRDVGTIVAQLDALSGDRGTIVIIASDNGPVSTDGHAVAFFDSTAGLRGQKRDLYEGGVRVPLIVRFPGQLGARELDVPVALYDLFPTITELVHTTAPVGMDGVSLGPWLRGERSDAAHATMYFSSLEGAGSEPSTRFSFHEGPLTLIERADDVRELYDLDADPRQEHDLAHARPDDVERMHAARVAAGTGVVSRTRPMLVVRESESGVVDTEARVVHVDLGDLVIGREAVTRTLELSNGAAVPARAMDLAFDRAGITDRRLSVEARDTTSITPDATPIVLTIRFVPDRLGALSEQRIVVHAIVRHVGDDAIGSPLVIEVVGTVVAAPSEVLPGASPWVLSVTALVVVVLLALIAIRSRSGSRRA